MKIAVIGGIGSGKSYVLNLIAGFNERVCDCDAIYKEIATTQKYKSELAKYFDVVKDGVIDRQKLGQIVFSDREKLQLLNSVAHPLVFERIDRIYSEKKSNLYVEVSAFDEKMADKFDKIIFVDTDKSLRVTRISDRSGYSKEYISKVMREQMSPENMKRLADYVIQNDCDSETLRQRVKTVIDEINSLN